MVPSADRSIRVSYTPLQAPQGDLGRRVARSDLIVN